MDRLDEEGANGEDVDVAALMGFGSFGDQHRGKRRRYNSRTNGAVVDGEQPELDTGKGKGKGRGNDGSGSGSGRGSGSNNLPLGTGRSRAKKGGAANAAESEGGGNAESSSYAASSQELPRPPSTDKLAPTPTPKPTPTPTPLPRPATGGDTSLPLKPLLPSLPHFSSKAEASMMTGTGKGTENDAWKWRKGVRLANGDVAYYDASFVEDPWRGLR